MNKQLSNSFFQRSGLPKELAWGYLGVIIFMMGDGVEQGWLSPYMIEHGMSMGQSASLFTVYGVTIAVSSWFSGVLTESYGPRRVMLSGLLLYILGTIGFVGYGMTHLHYPVMLVTYAIRGFGYPLFAYAFLVWITYNTPKSQLGRAVGWFWFVLPAGSTCWGPIIPVWYWIKSVIKIRFGVRFFGS